MKKLITTVFILVFVVFSTIGVKAGEWDEIYTTIEKSENSRELYNNMPTEVQKGDIVSVKLVTKNVSGWKLIQGGVEITWDDSAFEPVEVNGKYYTTLSNDIESVRFEIIDKNKAYMNYSLGDTVASENIISLVELKFKVKNKVSNGVYRVNLLESDNALSVYGNDNYYDTIAGYKSLKYQVGKQSITSNYSKNDINSNSYIIGSHLFTRAGSDEYNGVLTTEYIMLASKSIESNNKDDMIIYVKNAFGDWKNAITNTEISPPSEFNIEYVDMKANYSENGVYSSNDEKTILRLVQINENEAIITIENDKEIVHGLATINNKVATLTVDGKTYKITISENAVNIETPNSDSYIADKTLQKRANETVNDYFNDVYAEAYYSGFDGDGSQYYLKSSHTGKYTFGNYELYLVRVEDSVAKMCLKDKSHSGCIIDKYVITNEDPNYNIGGVFTTYALETENYAYGLDINGNNLTVSCLVGTCNSDYYGTYSKEKSLTMEDAFHIWERNIVKYAVTYDDGNGHFTVYVEAGKKLTDDVFAVPYEPEMPGKLFIGWQLNDEIYDFNNPVTGPMTLTALYRSLPGIPDLSISSDGDGHDYYDYADGVFQYHLTISLNEEYDGFDIFEKNGTNEPVASALNGQLANITIATSVEKTYFARAYVVINNIKHYGAVSDEITLHPVEYTVTFNSNGGSLVAPVVVPYSSTVDEPDPEPTRNLFDFVEWQWNNVAFNFSTPITGNITLTAKWHNNLAVPEVDAVSTNNFYQYNLYLANYDDYCTSLTGCNFNENDHYKISGYEVYKKVNQEYQKLSVEVGGNNKTQFAPYEYFPLVVEPNTISQYAIRVFAKEGAETIYSDSYSSDFEIDTTLAAPIIAFDSTLGTPNPANEVENWIKVTNLMSAYGHICGVDSCTSYKIEQFELSDKNKQPLANYNINDLINVTGSYNEDLHFYVRGVINYNGEPKYTDYSNELILDTTPPAQPMCYIDSDDGYHWTNNPQTGWDVVDGINNETDCHAPAQAMCYWDADNLEFVWTSNPDDSWTLVTTDESYNTPESCG